MKKICMTLLQESWSPSSWSSTHPICCWRWPCAREPSASAIIARHHHLLQITVQSHPLHPRHLHHLRRLRRWLHRRLHHHRRLILQIPRGHTAAVLWCPAVRQVHWRIFLPLKAAAVRGRVTSLRSSWVASTPSHTCSLVNTSQWQYQLAYVGTCVQ